MPLTVESQAFVGDTEVNFPVNIYIEKMTAELQEIKEEMVPKGGGKGFTPEKKTPIIYF
jgi:hypothetical protein